MTDLTKYAMPRAYTYLNRLLLPGILFLGVGVRPALSQTSNPTVSQFVVSGIVTPVQQSTLSTRVPARILSVLVTDSAPVHRGQALIQLDDSDLRTQLAASKATLKSAMAGLSRAISGRSAQKTKSDADNASAANGLTDAKQKQNQATLAVDAAVSENKADLETARTAAYKAKQSLERAVKTVQDLEALDKVGGVSRNDLEGARLQKRLAEADYTSALDAVQRVQAGPGGVPFKVASAKNDLEAATLGVRQAEDTAKAARQAGIRQLALSDDEIASARIGVTQAQVAVHGAEEALASMRLVSPIDGIATTVVARAGETAQPGTPLVTVVSLKNLRIEALFLARQIQHIHVGTHVSAAIDTLPGRAVDLVVSDISGIVEPDQRSIRVKLRFTHMPDGLRSGLSARITIAVRSRTKSGD